LKDTEEQKLALPEQFQESIQKTAVEIKRNKTRTGRKESRLATDPAVVIGTDAAAGDDVMHMGMMQGDSDPSYEGRRRNRSRAEMFGVAGNRHERLHAHAEEQS